MLGQRVALSARVSVALATVVAVAVACAPMRADVYEGNAPRQVGDVILNIGRHYAVVVSGAGTTTRQAPDPASLAVAAHGFTSVLTTTGEISGTDGQAWRRINDDTWAARDGLLVFDDITAAVDLAIELRVFSPPEVRQAILRRDTPPRFLQPSLSVLTRVPTASPANRTAPTGPTSTVTRTPTRTPTPTQTATRTTTGQAAPTRSGTPRAQLQPLFGVVIVDNARLFTRPGELVAAAPVLRIGSAITVEDRGVGIDGQAAVRLDSGLWLPAASVTLVTSPTEASAIGYQVTMASLSSGAPIDPEIAPAIWLLRREARVRYLADAIRDQKVSVRSAEMAEPSVLALYSFGDREIRVNSSLASADVRTLAAAMAHEATHAWEHAQGLVLDERDPSRCFEAELRAFRNQVLVWESFHGPNGVENPASSIEADMNEVQRMFVNEPQELKSRLVAKYGNQCGYHGPRPDIPTPEPRPPTPRRIVATPTRVFGTPVPTKSAAAPPAILNS